LDEEVDCVNNKGEKITNTPAMLTCVGPGSGEHVSLQVETYFTCAWCKVHVYNICKIKVGEKT
jgi:hypothetical protein